MYLGPAEDGSQNSKRGRGVGRPGVPHTRQRVSHIEYRVFPENGSLQLPVYSWIDGECSLKECALKQPFS